MIINPVPDMVTTTEIQRNPSILYSLKDDEYKVVVKGSQEISVLSSVPLFRNLVGEQRKYPRGKQPDRKTKLPAGIIAKLRMIKDPVAYQRKMRGW